MHPKSSSVVLKSGVPRQIQAKNGNPGSSVADLISSRQSVFLGGSSYLVKCGRRAARVEMGFVVGDI